MILRRAAQSKDWIEQPVSMWRKRQQIQDEKERVIKDVEKARERTMNRAVKLLAAKPRSVTELRERLLEKNWTNAEIVNRVISKLEEYGYLDDDRFAVGYASWKVKQRPIGRRRLERDLTMKKVERVVAEQALDQVFAETPETELIDQAIEKRTRIRGVPNNRAEAKSLFDHLLRQGFPFELISDKVRAIARTDLDEL